MECVATHRRYEYRGVLNPLPEPFAFFFLDLLLTQFSPIRFVSLHLHFFVLYYAMSPHQLYLEHPDAHVILRLKPEMNWSSFFASEFLMFLLFVSLGLHSLSKWSSFWMKWIEVFTFVFRFFHFLDIFYYLQR